MNINIKNKMSDAGKKFKEYGQRAKKYSAELKEKISDSFEDDEEIVCEILMEQSRSLMYEYTLYQLEKEHLDRLKEEKGKPITLKERIVHALDFVTFPYYIPVKMERELEIQYNLMRKR